MSTNQLIVFLLTFGYCECNIKKAMFYLEHTFANRMCPHDKVEFQEVVISVIECVRLCNTSPGCEAIIFNHGNKTCFGIQEHNPFSQYISMPGAEFYRASTTATTGTPTSTSSTTTAATTATPPTTTSTSSPTTATTTTTETTPTTTETPTPPTTPTSNLPTTATTTATSTTPSTNPSTTTTLTTTTATPPGCNESIPMVEPLADSQFSASSVHNDPGYDAFRARLSDTNNWTPQSNILGEYLQVDFLEPRVVTSIITRGDNTYNEWVTTYKVLISDDCTAFTAINDGFGIEKIFDGNVDKNSNAENVLEPPVVTRCLRIEAVTWSGAISFRIEAMGCLA